jgi:hypothetical protein
MENELEKVLESKFFCPSRVAQEIESLVQTNPEMNYIDAIVHFCEQNNIKYEAMELNFLKRSSRARLPL